MHKWEEKNLTNSDQPKRIVRCINSLEEAKASIERLSQRTSGKAQKDAIHTVNTILIAIENEGDDALIKYTLEFDGYKPDPLEVPQGKLKQAWDESPTPLKEALQLAHRRIKDFHAQQKPKDLYIQGEHGEILCRRWRPVQKAGLYIPGGRAAYPSTVLMNAIPAKVAGVKEIVMTSPGDSNGSINQTVLAAAYLSGVNKVLRIGGAQAIGAMAYGTKSINKVDVISGPGNIYVTLAKKSVYGKVGIDSLAGPSEVLIIADKSAAVEHVAADLLAQAEHDPLAAAVLLTTESELAEQLPKTLHKQLENHPRANICLSSLENWGLIIVCKDINECLELSDQFAPEHVELLIENPRDVADKINNAGAIFLGPWSPEAVGDYLAGPNHTLPTSGTARFSGALCVETFMKNTSMIEFTKSAFENSSNAVQSLATSEGLYSHAESIKIRSDTL